MATHTVYGVPKEDAFKGGAMRAMPGATHVELEVAEEYCDRNESPDNFETYVIYNDETGEQVDR